MNPADRAALRKTWAVEGQHIRDDDAVYSDPALLRATRAQLSEMFDYCERLEGAIVRSHCDLRWYENDTATSSVALVANAALGFTPQWEMAAHREYLEAWERRQDAQAVQKAQGYASCPQVGCPRLMPHEHHIEGPADAITGEKP